MTKPFVLEKWEFEYKGDNIVLTANSLGEAVTVDNVLLKHYILSFNSVVTMEWPRTKRITEPWASFLNTCRLETYGLINDTNIYKHNDGALFIQVHFDKKDNHTGWKHKIFELYKAAPVISVRADTKISHYDGRVTIVKADPPKPVKISLFQPL